MCWPIVVASRLASIRQGGGEHGGLSRHAALSWKHALKIEAQLRAEVKALTARAGAAHQTPVGDGLGILAEIARRERRLLALEAAKAAIEARAQERFEGEQRVHEEKMARRQALREAGKEPGGKHPKPAQPGPRNGDQVNPTDQDSRIMPKADQIPRAGFLQPMPIRHWPGGNDAGD